MKKLLKENETLTQIVNDTGRPPTQTPGRVSPISNKMKHNNVHGVSLIENFHQWKFYRSMSMLIHSK